MGGTCKQVWAGCDCGGMLGLQFVERQLLFGFKELLKDRLAYGLKKRVF
jgi:hypothetical protein